MMAETEPVRSNEMMHRLNDSFETFIGVTEELKQAYDRLRERADAMDLKLKDANRSLKDKVLELDGLTNRLNDLIQGMPSAVVAVDAGGRITHFNRIAERTLGLEAGEVKGRSLKRVEPLSKVLLMGNDAAAKPGEERDVETLDGRRLVVTSRIAELNDAKGRPAGRIEILTDLTETHRLRREVHRLDTLAAMGEMAAAVAHQIRNPLNGVEGFASLLHRKLKDENGSADARRFAGNVVQGVRQVNAVISGMLMLARSDSLQMHDVDLDALLEETASELEGNGVEIRLDLNLKGRSIRADGLKLKQVFLNMGHNALEALEEGRRRAVRMSTRWNGEGPEIRIADSGRGIRKAGKIFQPFYTSREQGTGLGLSIASKIVDLHGGAIRFRSLHGVGTVFKILLKQQSGERDD
jgi:PAS domain S-box-containing protein